jgi:hypothetical protein
MLLSLLLVAASVGLIAINIFLHTAAFYYIAIGCVLMAIQTFTSGLIAALLKQILQQHEQSSGRAPSKQEEPAARAQV